jgi:hypothetical protein
MLHRYDKLGGKFACLQGLDSDLDDVALADLQARQANMFRCIQRRTDAAFDASLVGLIQHGDADMDTEVEDQGWSSLRQDLVHHYVYHKRQGNLQWVGC